MKPLKISEFHLRENSFKRNNKSYRVVDLIEAAKDLDVFDLPICGIDIAVAPWGNQNIRSFVYHMERVNNANLDYPVILDNEGYICDGWHRVSKAMLLGKITIKAKRLIVMPEPESETKE